MSEHQFGDVFENEYYIPHMLYARYIHNFIEKNGLNKKYIDDRYELISFLDEITNEIYSLDDKSKYT